MKSTIMQKGRRVVSFMAAILMAFSFFAMLPVQVEAATLTPPIIFSGKVDSATTPASVVLQWRAHGTGNGFVVYRAEGTDTNHQEIATINTTSTKTYTDKTAQPGKTYFYRVRVYEMKNGQRKEGVATLKSVKATMPASAVNNAVPAPMAVSVPTLIGYTATDSSVTVNWGAVTGATRYGVYRATTQSGNYATVTTNATGTSYTDQGLAAGSTYFYKVKAFSGTEESDFSTPLQVATRATAQAPVLSGVTAQTGPNRMVINWQQTPGVEQYVLWRSVNGATFENIATVTSSVLSYTDNNIQTGVEYSYKLQAVYPDGTTSSYSNTISKTISNTGGQIAINVTAQNYNLVRLAISAQNMNSNYSYSVYRATSETGNYQYAGTALPNATSYEDTDVQPNSTYWYYVVRQNAAGGEITSNKVRAVTPQAPAGSISLSGAAASPTRINLTFVPTDITGNAVYTVYRATQQYGNYSNIGTANASALVYPDPNVAPNTTYWYYVTRQNAATGALVSSGKISVTTPPEVPSTNPRIILSGTLNSQNPDSQIDLTFQAIDIGGNGNYTIYVADSESGNYSVVSGAPSSATSYTDEELDPGTTYWYYVKRKDATTNKDIFSNKISITTQQTPATNPRITLSATRNSQNPDSQIDLTFQAIDISGNGNYTIYVADSESGNYSVVSGAPSSATSYTDEELDPGTTYWYYVKRKDTTTNKDIFSDKVSATTAELQGTISLSANAPAPNRVNLSFVPTGIAGTNNYQIFRSESEIGPYIYISAATTTATSYSNTSVQPNTTYWYYVTRQDASGKIITSNTVSVTTPDVQRSIGLTANAPAQNQVTLSFAPTGIAGTNSYQIFRSDSENGTYNYIRAVASNATTYNDTAVQPNTTYWYYVSRQDASGAIVKSNKVSVKTPVPPVVRNIDIAANAPAYNRVNLAITPTNITGQGSYSVFRSTSQSGGYSYVGAAAAGDTSYSDTNVQGNTTYWYYVTRQDASGAIVTSNTVSVLTPERVQRTIGLSAMGQSDTQVILHMTPTAITGNGRYTIYRGTAENGPFTNIGSAAATEQFYYDNNATPDTEHWYYVTRQDASGEIVTSNKAFIVTMPSPSTEPRIIIEQDPSNPKKVNITGVNFKDDYYYQVFRSRYENGVNGMYDPIGRGGYTLKSSFYDNNASGTYWYFVNRYDPATRQWVQSNKIRIDHG